MLSVCQELTYGGAPDELKEVGFELVLERFKNENVGANTFRNYV